MNEWISVYSSLPGYDKLVLVNVIDPIKNFVTIANLDEVFGWHKENGEPLKKCRISHWMPLPEPPEQN
jgi:hypothetical protein